jgi:hypothetical protein
MLPFPFNLLFSAARSLLQNIYSLIFWTGADLNLRHIAAFQRILLAVISAREESPDLDYKPLYSLPKVGKYNLNLMMSQSFDYVLYWLVTVEGPDAFSQLHRTEVAGMEMKLITAFMKHHFVRMREESFKCLNLVEDVMKATKRWETKV